MDENIKMILAAYSLGIISVICCFSTILNRKKNRFYTDNNDDEEKEILPLYDESWINIPPPNKCSL